MLLFSAASEKVELATQITPSVLLFSVGVKTAPVGSGSGEVREGARKRRYRTFEIGEVSKEKDSVAVSPALRMTHSN